MTETERLEQAIALYELRKMDDMDMALNDVEPMYDACRDQLAILKGEMVVVGPKPLTRDMVAECAKTADISAWDIPLDNLCSFASALIAAVVYRYQKDGGR